MKRTIVGVHEAKTHFSKLLRKAEAGEEVVVASSGKPVAKLVRYESVETREPGLLAGQITIKPGFDKLPEGLEAFIK